MASVTFAIDEKLKPRLDRFPWVNWSEVARVEALSNERKADLFRELEKLTGKSSLSDKDNEELGMILKDRIWRKLKPGD